MSKLLQIFIFTWLSCCSLCKCAVFFTTNSEWGIFFAISLPVDLLHRNVFFSYNFEANYYLASTWLLPPILNDDTPDLDSLSSRKINGLTCTNCTETINEEEPKVLQTDNEDKIEETTTTTELPTTNEPTTSGESTTAPNVDTASKNRVKRSMLSRTDFYHIFIDKLQRSGLQGENCLLRLICEVNASHLADANGVLGSLMHVIFTPSSSQNEDLPIVYYKAEMHGLHDQCDKYEHKCDDSVLDMITMTAENILNDMLAKRN